MVKISFNNKLRIDVRNRGVSVNLLVRAQYRDCESPGEIFTINFPITLAYSLGTGEYESTYYEKVIPAVNGELLNATVTCLHPAVTTGQVLVSGSIVGSDDYVVAVLFTAWITGANPVGYPYSFVNSIDEKSGLHAIYSFVSRPANVTPYAINDVVNVAATVTNIFLGVTNGQGGKGTIYSAILSKSTATVTDANFTVYFFKPGYVSAIVDQDPFVFPTSQANQLAFLGSIPFSMRTNGAGGGAYAVATNVNLDFVLEYDSNDMQFFLVADSAYVPGSEESFTLKLNVDRRIV